MIATCTPIARTITDGQISKAVYFMSHGFDPTKDTIDKKKRLAGAITEVHIAEWIKVPHSGKFKFDFNIKGKRIEVKTANQNGNYSPPYSYESGVSNRSTINCDYFLFCRLLWNHKLPEHMKKLWIMGMISQTDFDDKAEFFNEGDIVSSNGHKCTCDCHIIKYKHLSPAHELLGVEVCDECE